MKKLNFFLLFILSFSFSACNSNNETIGIRNIYIESSNYDLAYIKNKYSIYINNDNFEINEIYNDSNSIIAKNSLENDIQIDYNAYVNIKEQYFIFSYTLSNNNEIILSLNVNVSVIEYENTHYFRSCLWI